LLSVIPFPQKIFVLILAPAVGRWSFTYGIIKYPYARSKPGLGSIYGKDKKNNTLLIATTVLIIAGYLTFNWQGLILIAAAFIFVIILNKIFLVFLGGLTGDTYGAAGELVETWVLLCAALLDKVVLLLG
jgi:adenosylcobinamide-GDP ribazoletransferase